ncbi:MAG TPA: CPBP family intramembrane glutamic endopeptidase [Candidatus Nitrosotenuis sp.]|nr:CPBP family intramembrane glutamic endopeptidase [Candidatus Nitrosotenuis sp.]
MNSDTTAQAPIAKRPIVRPFFCALAAIPTGLLVVALSAWLARAISQRVLGGADEQFIFYLFVDPGLLLLFWLLLKFLDRRHFHNMGLWLYPGWLREVWQGIAIGAVLIAFCIGVLVPGPWLDYASVNSFDGRGLLFTALFLFLAAAFEEIVFRGYIFQRLLDSIGALGAMLVLSAFFGWAHLDNPNATALSTANTILAGILLAVAYLKTRGLWLPIALHWAWNFFLGPIFSLPVSGFDIGPNVFVARVSGPVWLSGGAYGLEGSVVLTVACTAAILWLWLSPGVRPTPIMAELFKDPQKA